jgi:glutathione S-transferase
MANKDYLAGDFSAADTMLGHSILMTDRMGLLADNFPNLSAYVARLKARPALQKAFALEGR